MDIPQMFQVVGAMIMANAASFAFFMGAMKMSRHQAQGGSEETIPIWAWFCCLPAPLLMSVGFAIP